MTEQAGTSTHSLLHADILTQAIYTMMVMMSATRTQCIRVIYMNCLWKREQRELRIGKKMKGTKFVHSLLL